MTATGRDGKPLVSLNALTAEQIEAEFVSDAVAFYATDFNRLMRGAEKIAAERRVKVETVWVGIEAQYTELTGKPFPTNLDSIDQAKEFIR